ncbi:uncharacterized protein LOC108035053 [Drosophila biarmipes]|uniref:uncharacterized protein LOC108035053 n=1 Tax=Drosophila biarmipes TaxID=125945 RepID=UPI0007E8196E|nr:uncharacterized protein LOC108035053 [Drosophila biarmipes]
MWTSLILSVILLHSLAAAPAPGQKALGTDSWSADTACQELNKSAIIENQNDATCVTFVYCYIANGSTIALVKSCKSGQYFDSELRICSINKPEGCE